MRVMCVADCEGENEEEGRATRSAAVFHPGEQQSPPSLQALSRFPPSSVCLRYPVTLRADDHCRGKLGLDRK